MEEVEIFRVFLDCWLFTLESDKSHRKHVSHTRCFFLCWVKQILLACQICQDLNGLLGPPPAICVCASSSMHKKLDKYYNKYWRVHFKKKTNRQRKGCFYPHKIIHHCPSKVFEFVCCLSINVRNWKKSARGFKSGPKPPEWSGVVLCECCICRYWGFRRGWDLPKQYFEVWQALLTK